MYERYFSLIAKAFALYGQISLAGKSLEACFTEEKGKFMFWFNDSKNSTGFVIEA
jgi:hypothetical protein